MDLFAFYTMGKVYEVRTHVRTISETNEQKVSTFMKSVPHGREGKEMITMIIS